MKTLVILSIFLAALSYGSANVNYCSICANHVVCLNPGRQWGPTCPADAALSNLDQEMINIFVDEHNKYRNQLASGSVAGLPSATNMRKLVGN